LIWGEYDHVILMLEVKHFSKNCSISRNVVFLLDTGAPFTVISSAVRRLILEDCKLIEKKGSLQSLGIKINGR
jgi:predicted aspartyl protease